MGKLDDDIFTRLKVPKQLWDVMEFAGVKFRHRNNLGSIFLRPENFVHLDEWLLCMPTNISGKQVEIPLPEKIDETNSVEHWRTILAAAADFQYLVNSGQYVPA